MKLIQRNEYLNKLIRVIGTPDIKLVTGVRHSGKSKLLEAFRDYLKKSSPSANVVYINFNLPECEHLLECETLYQYISEHYQQGAKNYILLDDIQMCKEGEKVIASLHASRNFDIYIVASHMFLPTSFSEQIYAIIVYPFSFKEYMEYFSFEEPYDAFNRYVLEGGIAGSYIYQDSREKRDYIVGLVNTVIVQDIQRRYRIRNAILMDRIVNFLINSNTELISVRGITDALRTNTEKYDHKTVGNYLEYLCASFTFHQIQRYNIHEKKCLASNKMYYPCDHTFQYVRTESPNINYKQALKNIIAVELMRRGYDIYIGVFYKKEIDFVAIRDSQKLYIQVLDNISDEKTFQDKLKTLLQIRDAYPKLILACTWRSAYQYEGVQVIDLSTWLMSDDIKSEQMHPVVELKDRPRQIDDMTEEELLDGLNRGVLSVADFYNATMSRKP